MDLSNIRFLVLTGGPGAGKTAVIEMAKIYFNDQIKVLPESASILFKGGFPRTDSIDNRKASQRCIYSIQHELEQLMYFEAKGKLVLCDRGTLDGLAYWPGPDEEYFREMNTSLEEELAKYKKVLHLNSPILSQGYNHQNPVRSESAEEAANINNRLKEVWAKHPKRVCIESTDNFLDKVYKALAEIEKSLKEI